MQQRTDDAATPLPRALPAAGLLASEDVIAPMEGWMRDGQRAVLVTLVGIEGGAPRHVGAQMAVAADGRSAGYLSGGCLEQAIVLEALDVIAKGANRLVRYGQGSRYVDIRLPCGSGLDVYFDQGLAPDQIALLGSHARARRPALLTTHLQSGQSIVSRVDDGAPVVASHRAGDLFVRGYPAATRLMLIGTGPGLVGIATLAAAIGVELVTVALDDATRRSLDAAGLALDAGDVDAAVGLLDEASAAILVLHDHDREPEILAKLLGTQCFHIGALGNHAVHRSRLAALAEMGFDAAQCRRISAPVGAIPGAKSAATLAVGVLMEVMASAKARGLVA